MPSSEFKRLSPFVPMVPAIPSIKLFTVENFMVFAYI